MILEDFNREGYCVVKDAFDHANCAALREQLAHLSSSLDSLELKPPSLLRLGKWAIKNPHTVSESFREQLRARILQNSARTILGEDVDFFWSLFSAKPPGAKKFSWHQDGASWSCKSSFLICWTALQPVHENNGCLWVLPRSHRQELRSHEFREDAPDEYAGIFARQEEVCEDSALPICMETGDMICMHSNLLHKSGANLTETQRLGWACAFIASGNEGPHVMGLPEHTIPYLREGFLSEGVWA